MISPMECMTRKNYLCTVTTFPRLSVFVISRLIIQFKFLFDVSFSGHEVWNGTPEAYKLSRVIKGISNYVPSVYF